MKTDRTLLELAAKAYGIEVPKKLNNWLTYDDKYGFQWWNMDGTKAEKSFNPMNDDGDALRLAASKEMCIDFMNKRVIAGEFLCDFLDGDYKRAIVLAAAAIGEAM